MITQHITMTNLKIDKSSCKYTAKLLHTKSIFGKVYSTNNVLVSGFATASDVKVQVPAVEGACQEVLLNIVPPLAVKTAVVELEVKDTI